MKRGEIRLTGKGDGAAVSTMCYKFFATPKE
jgi:hypothetical protein